MHSQRLGVSRARMIPTAAGIMRGGDELNALPGPFILSIGVGAWIVSDV
jgi:hypothetical protein